MLQSLGRNIFSRHPVWTNIQLLLCPETESRMYEIHQHISCAFFYNVRKGRCIYKSVYIAI